MNSWNEGYFTDTTYTYGYYRELSPNFMRWCLLIRGIVAPELTRDSCHCELGFGQGVSANIHAAATPGKFFGTDFNPAHAAQAKELAEASGADANFFEDSFEEFSKRDDLPPFDTIGLHGIWTWVSAENRRHIMEIAQRHLKSGGVLYNSYNCLPGWAPAAPLRELLVLFYKNFQRGGNSDERVKSALDAVGEMIDIEPAYTKVAPNFKTSFEKIQKLDPHYIAHEYLNLDWDLMYFSDVAEISQAAKLDFATTANPLESLESLIGSEKIRNFLNKFDNPIIREQLKDYFTNRQFRRDLFVRGIRRITVSETYDKILAMHYVLTAPADKVPLKFSSEFGEFALSEEVYRPLLEYLQEDNFRPKNLLEYQRRSKLDSKSLFEAIIIFVSSNYVLPCQSDAAVELVKKSCDKLNAHICERSNFGGEFNFLASPLTGCGIALNQLQQIFLAQYKSGLTSSDELAGGVWNVLARQGRAMILQGKTLKTPEENINFLSDLAKEFLSKNIPILKALLLA